MTKEPLREEESLLKRFTAFETALIAGGLIVFAVLLYEMRDFLNPPLLAVAGVCVLWPLRQYPTVRALLLTGGLLLGLWLLTTLSTVLIPFVLAYVVAYLFDPAVGYLRRRYRVPRWVSSLGITALLVGAVALIVLLLVPSVVHELEALGQRIIKSVADLRTWVITSPLIDRLEDAGVVDRQELLTQLTALLQAQAAWLTGSIPRAVQQVLQSITSILGIIMAVAIVPALTFYMLKDYPLIKRRLIELFPTFGGRRDYLVRASSLAGKYLRGQLLIGAIAAFNVSVLLTLFNVPFALLIGLLAGILNLIPTLGAILTFIIGILLMMIFGDPWLLHVVIVVAVLLGENVLEQTVLTPNILGHQVGLHPVLILLSLFVFGYFMGIVGLLIAVPTTALLVTFYKTYRKEFAIDITDTNGTGETPDVPEASAAEAERR